MELPQHEELRALAVLPVVLLLPVFASHAHVFVRHLDAGACVVLLRRLLGYVVDQALDSLSVSSALQIVGQELIWLT